MAYPFQASSFIIVAGALPEVARIACMDSMTVRQKVELVVFGRGAVRTHLLQTMETLISN
jgi:hypothetical protein